MDTQAPDAQRVELSLEELYQIIGELEVLRRKQQQMLTALTKRAETPRPPVSGPPEPQ